MKATYIREDDGATMVEVQPDQFVAVGVGATVKGVVVELKPKRGKSLSGPGGMSLAPWRTWLKPGDIIREQHTVVPQDRLISMAS